MTLYLHKLTVIVVSPECSSDAVERKIESLGDAQYEYLGRNRPREPHAFPVDHHSQPSRMAGQRNQGRL